MDVTERFQGGNSSGAVRLKKELSHFTKAAMKD
jgi:hypothetical protein